MNEHMFLSTLQENNIRLDENQLKQFHLYYQLLIEWNNKMNLTRITEKSSVYEKHFWDSLTPLIYYDFSSKNVCDVGAGAGFPSIPMLIANPNFSVTIIDSLNKRIKFLQHLVEELKLSGVTLIHGRAEDVANQKEHREQYDIVTARAVANLSTLAELCLPLCKEKNGLFIALKATKAEEELNHAHTAIERVGGLYSHTKKLYLPISNEERNLLFIKKMHRTPDNYPRKAGTPAKFPL